MATLLPDSSGNEGTRTHDNDNVGLGELLRRARERHGLTLEQIANQTKIPKRHLKALEHDNLSAVPGEFYRRAEIRAYAQAVKLDPNLALAHLERSFGPPAARETPPRAARNQAPTLSRSGQLIVIGVVVAAALFGRAIRGRDDLLEGNARVRSATDSPQHSLRPVRTTLPGAVVANSERPHLDQVAPSSAHSEPALAVAMESTDARTPADPNGDLAPTVTPTEAPASGVHLTGLAVNTQPAGARVTVNGIGWGVTPVTIRFLPAGDKRIRVSKDGYTTEERVVRLAEGHQQMVDIPLRSEH